MGRRQENRVIGFKGFKDFLLSRVPIGTVLGELTCSHIQKKSNKTHNYRKLT